MALPVRIRTQVSHALVAALPDTGAIDDSAETLARYARDWTENADGTPPDFVVRARSTEDVKRVVDIARENGVPVVPIVAGRNLGGLALPSAGGIVLDLSGMNRILEVDPADLYMVIEPGVSWAQVSEHLAKHHPEVRFAYPTAPPYTSVLANCLMDGLVNLSTRHGTTGSWLGSLEVVLADGRVLVTGSAAFGGAWWGSSPMPDLAGLFRNFQGTTGIVTRASVQLWPARGITRRYFLPAHETGPACRLLARLAREDLFDDLSGLSWPLPKLVFGATAPFERASGEPAFFLYVEFSADRASQIEVAQSVLAEHLARVRREGGSFEEPIAVEDLVRIEPAFRPFAELPAEMTFLTDSPGGGLTWVGSYGPASRWEQAIEAGQAALLRHGFPPSAVFRAMKLGHFGTLLFPILFDREDDSDLERVRAANREIADGVVALGFVPFKTPRWVVERFRDSIDPTFLSVVRDVQKLLDPNRMLNPGNWR